MRSSAEIEPLDDDERYVWGFDQRDTDNPNKSAFTRLIYLQRIERILELARRHVPTDGRIADIGCAQGNVAITLAESGYAVDAFDLNASFIAYSKKKYERGDLTWHQGNAFEIAGLESSFDAVIMGEIVEHVAHPYDLLTRAVGLVKPGGVVVVTTPNGAFVRSRLPSYAEVIGRGDLARIEREQFGPGGEHHLFAYTIDELRGHVPSNARVVQIGYFGSGLLNSHSQRLLNTPIIGYGYSRLARAFPLIPGLGRYLSLTLVLVIERLS